MSVTLHHGDCLDVLRAMPDNSVDAIVTDPPYGLGFMGKEWDDLPPGEEWATECLRVLKPGGHMLAFGGARTWHRLACAVEDAGFEVRDSIAWLYGSGFPKSLDVSKAIDKQRQDNPDWRAVGSWLRERRTASGVSAKALCAAIGAHGEVNHGGAVSNWENGFSCPTWEQWEQMRGVLGFPDEMDAEVWRLNGRKGTPGEAWIARPITQAEVRPLMSGDHISFDRRSSTERERRDIPATPAAQQWQGWGTALKPAFEPVVVARKPLTGTVAANVQAWGTGALNIDATRVEGGARPLRVKTGTTEPGSSFGTAHTRAMGERANTAGRWPANVVLDESQAEALDQQSGITTSSGGSGAASAASKNGRTYGDYDAPQPGAWGSAGGLGDRGGASRFFHIAREDEPRFRYVAKAPTRERPKVDGVAHPTVKPLTLMRWLVRLVTPPGGTVLEPFAGSGTTVEAALLEGFNVIAIEREADYLPLIEARIARVTEQPKAEPSLFDLGEETA